MAFRLKYVIRNVVIPIITVYIICHFVYFSIRLFQVDTSRIGYENLKDGPLLLKPGKHIKKNGNVIEAIGYGKLAFFDGNKKRDRKKTKSELQNNKSHADGAPKLSESKVKLVVDNSRSILNTTSGEFIYVTLVNKAYERMTLNWICNIAMMKNVNQKVLIIATDQSICDSIKSQWDDTIRCVSLNIPNYEGSYDWGRQKYINLLTIRANLMQKLTEADIPYILFETDATWFRDPIILFENRTNSYEDFDIIVPIKGYDGGKHDTLAFDPMFVMPTNGSKHFLVEMTSRLNKNKKLYDQDVMNELCGTQYNGLVCRTFEYEEISDGKWFKTDQRDRSVPFIVNNNFYSGTKNKETRQSLNGLWFLATRTNQCVITKVAKFMELYKTAGFQL